MARIDAGRLEDFAEGIGRVVEFGEREAAIFRVGEELFAIGNRCPHAGGSLAGGAIDEGAVICPWHGWRFDLTTGSWLDAPKAGLNAGCFPVVVEQGRVFVEIEPDESVR